MSFNNPLVEEINNKIGKIVSERDALKINVSQLEQRIIDLESAVQREKSSLEELEQKYKVLKLAKSIEGGETEQGKDLKLKINEMVREIDKCIALLNK